jgi:hypothetical protein
VFLLRARELRCDVAVVGGGTGGCAAALAAARNGLRVILTEETDWLGGQLTAQAVPPDEHPWIEMFGCTLYYRTYRQSVREYYRRNYPLTAEARAIANLNPGGGGVSHLTHEPRVSVAVIEEMLAPYIGAGRLTVLLRHKAIAADVTGDRVGAVTVKDLESGASRSIQATYFLDATEQGDLLIVLRGVDDPLDGHAVFAREVEDQVVLKTIYPPHSRASEPSLQDSPGRHLGMRAKSWNDFSAACRKR